MNPAANATYGGHDATAALVGVEDVARLVAQQGKPGAVVHRRLADALGMVLAEPIRAEADFPAFDKSMMDGFAVRAADVGGVPAELALVGEIAAGITATRALGPGEAMRINTGAPLPDGADAVVMVERTEMIANRVRVLASVRAGQNVAAMGSVCRAGQAVLDAPVRIGPAQIGAAATTGATELGVFERPRLALLPTGNEVVAGGQSLRPGQIHESNGPSLAALGRTLGAEVVDLGICGDDRAALRDRLTRGLECPILVVVGGMSMGTLDLVPEALRERGVQWLVHGVDMRPGRPMGYGVGPAGQHVFGLPGNPASSFVCFCLFVRAAIDGLSGLPARLPTFWNARLAGDVRSSKDPRPAYLPARLSVGADGSPEVEPVAWQGSGDPIGLGRANALLHQPVGGAAMSAGQTARVMAIGALLL